MDATYPRNGAASAGKPLLNGAIAVTAAPEDAGSAPGGACRPSRRSSYLFIWRNGTDAGIGPLEEKKDCNRPDGSL